MNVVVLREYKTSAKLAGSINILSGNVRSYESPITSLCIPAVNE